MASPKDVRQDRIVRLLRLGAMVRQQSSALRAETVCERLKISRRTFHRDIRLLREAGVRIQYRAATGTYVAEAFASVFGESLTVEEAAALAATMTGARPKPKTHYARAMTNLRAKIDTILREQFVDAHDAIETTARMFASRQSQQ